VSRDQRTATAHFHGGPLDGRHEPLVVSDEWGPGETVGVTHPDPAAAAYGRYHRSSVNVHTGAIKYAYLWCDDPGCRP
jgi:hypothetical protein